MVILGNLEKTHQLLQVLRLAAHLLRRGREFEEEPEAGADETRDTPPGGGEALMIVRAHEQADMATLLASSSFTMAAIQAAAGDAAVTAARLEAQIDVLTAGRYQRPTAAMASAGNSEVTLL